MLTLGTAFSGIGGFELGLERSMPIKTIFQIENDVYARKVLRRHWPKTKLYGDIRKIKTQLDNCDVLAAGFPCQGFAICGPKDGFENEKSYLYWELYRHVCGMERKPRVIILENSPNLLISHGAFDRLLGSLVSLRYNIEWTILSCSQFGAPHERKRLFIVAYKRPDEIISGKGKHKNENKNEGNKQTSSDTDSQHSKKHRKQIAIFQEFDSLGCGDSFDDGRRNHWERFPNVSPFCGGDDGFSDKFYKHRRQRIKCLGNSVSPVVTEYIGECIMKSGILDSSIKELNT